MSWDSGGILLNDGETKDFRVGPGGSDGGCGSGDDEENLFGEWASEGVGVGFRFC